jgi:hypothetical protein
MHGVTSAWALSNIIYLMNSNEMKLEMLQNFLCVLLAVYIAQDCPKLNPDYLTSPDVSNITWGDIIERTLKLPLGTDEHKYKLVQVCIVYLIQIFIIFNYFINI